MPKNANSVKFFFLEWIPILVIKTSHSHKAPKPLFNDINLGRSMNELLNAAVELMLLGMGTVFVFLVLLIVATKTMSAVLMRIAVEEESDIKLASAPAVASISHVQDPRFLKAISEAIKQHRAS